MQSNFDGLFIFFIAAAQIVAVLWYVRIIDKN